MISPARISVRFGSIKLHSTTGIIAPFDGMENNPALQNDHSLFCHFVMETISIANNTEALTFPDSN